MFNNIANGRIYDNIYMTCSKKIYSRLVDKSDEVLQRYRSVLQPKGFIKGAIALFDTDRQLKIDCIDDILLSRKESKNRSVNLNSSNGGVYNDVNPMISDYDKKLLDESDRLRRSRSYGMFLSGFISRGYMKP